MSNHKVYLDMDGVLCDFVGAICAAHGRPNVYEHPETRGKSLGHFDIEKLWGMNMTEFWVPAQTEEFWANLSPTKEAFETVDLVYSLFGKTNTCVLTSPPTYITPLCFGGKQKWVAKYFPELSKRVIFGHDKYFLSGPNRILVDDRDRNVWDWAKHGGKPAIVPRLWNYKNELADQSFSYVKTQLMDIAKEG